MATSSLFFSSSSDVHNENVGPSALPKLLNQQQFITIIGLSTSKVVAGIFFLVLAYRRDSYILTFFIGSILNAISSKILKHVLDQDRPDENDDNDLDVGTIEKETMEKIDLPSDKGMPSSHATCLGFIGMYTSVALWDILVSASCVGGGGRVSIAMMATMVYSMLWSYVAVSLVYRVKKRLHTIEQVLVGLFFGITNAFFWNSLAHGTNPLFTSINVMDMVSSYLLPEGNTTVLQCIVTPAIVNVVGLFNRQLLGWLRMKTKRL